MTEAAAKRQWGNESRLVLRRIQSLLAATTLGDLRNAPGRLHPLAGDRAGQFAMSITAVRRLVFEPTENPPPLLPDGGLDIDRVTEVRVLEVVDYHGR